MSDTPWVDRMFAGHRNTLGRNPTPEKFRQHRVMLNMRLRAAYLAGVAQRYEVAHGRPPTKDEIREALAEYPGDMPTAR